MSDIFYNIFLSVIWIQFRYMLGGWQRTFVHLIRTRLLEKLCVKSTEKWWRSHLNPFRRSSTRAFNSLNTRLWSWYRKGDPWDSVGLSEFCRLLLSMRWESKKFGHLIYILITCLRTIILGAWSNPRSHIKQDNNAICGWTCVSSE